MRRELGTTVIIALVCAAAFTKEHRFLQPESLSSILLWIPMLAIVGLGQMLVIVTRGIDVSVGSMVGFAAMCAGLAFKTHPGLPVSEGAVIAILAGLLLGCINGLLIAVAKVPPIIATLGGLSAYRGLIFIVSKGAQVDSNDLPDSLNRLTLDGPLKLCGITVPWILFLTLGIAGVMALVIRYTRFGRNVYAIGGNPEAARLRGIPVAREVFFVYALAGALSGFAGLVYASRFGFVNAGSAGKGLELVVIAAVVMGGSKVTGGTGSVLGTILGSLLLGVASVALAVTGVSEDYQPFVYGSIILIALLIDFGFQRFSTRQRWVQS